MVREIARKAVYFEVWWLENVTTKKSGVTKYPAVSRSKFTLNITTSVILNN